MKIRNFTCKDVDALIDCWNHALPHDTVQKSHFIKKLVLDVNFDPNGFFIVEEAEMILGFINCVYRKVAIDGYSGLEENDGWISAFAINDNARFEEVGAMLLQSAERYFLSLGKRNISTGYYPVYFYQGFSKAHWPAYIQLFEKHGYSYYESLARDLNLSNYIPNSNTANKKKALESDGFYIGEIKDEYIYSLINPNEPFNSSCGAYEFKLRLAELDYARIRIAAKDGHIVGVCLFGDPLGSPERFGPFVVSPEYQGKGIGTVLLDECLTEMKKRGLHCAWMQWTPTSGAADFMYQKVGFQTTKTYLTFSKTL